MDSLTLTGFLLMGLTGSLHCAGMCGPILCVMPFQHLSGLRRWAAIGLYHAGRIGAYCLLGALFFSLRSAFQPQWQQGVALVSGGLLILIGVLSFFGNRWSRLIRPLANLLTAALSRFAGRPAPGWLTLTGLLNGLLPCGMVYMALGASMKSPNAGYMVLCMAAFGLGTLPMLLAVTVLRRRIRFASQRWTNVVILVFGLLITLRGANLGIPYLSPERMAAGPEVKMSCCHNGK